MEVVRNEEGKPFNKWQPAEKFAYVWEREGLCSSDLTTELVFDAVRKWRFDFAWRSRMVAVEIDGFGYGHQAQQNIADNNEKQNAAIEQGWKVLRFDSRLLGSRQKVSDAVEQVCRVLCGTITQCERSDIAKGDDSAD